MTGWSLAGFLLLPATVIVLRRREGSWFSPATFFAATWTAFASLSLLNPLGVPHRMNIGQIMETHLGWAAVALGMKIATPVFDGIKEKDIREYLKEAKLPLNAKTMLYDGRTGEVFDQEIVVGYIYMMKLGHLVADKIHARAVGAADPLAARHLAEEVGRPDVLELPRLRDDRQPRPGHQTPASVQLLVDAGRPTGVGRGDPRGPRHPEPTGIRAVQRR